MIGANGARVVQIQAAYPNPAFDGMTEELSSFEVVLQAGKGFWMIGEDDDARCESCQTPVGTSSDGFVPYTADDISTLLCLPCSRTSVLQIAGLSAA